MKDTLKILKCFKDATDLATQQKYPTIYSTVLIYNFLLNMLEDMLNTTGEQLNICLALTAAIDKLKTYYSATDSSMYYIGTGK